MDTNGDAHSDSVASSAPAGDVDATLKSLLDVLTEDRFDPVLDWIVGWMNTECVKDVRKLAPVTYAIFERAKDDAASSDLYARLCRKMMEQISPNVHDNGIKNADGKPIAGGQLFRKYLLNRCQEDFERGWVAKEATAAAAATKASEDQVAKAAAGQNKGEEQVLYSEEYYAAQKAKRQGLGLIKFIGELFKLQMLTERIMHECVKKLLQNVEHPDEEEISSLCTLMTTVGQALDTQKARAHMDVYFSRMKELSRRLDVNSGMRSMLQDVIELRERKWIHKNVTAAPSTMTAIHELAFNRQLRMSRGDSRRGGERGDHAQVGPDGWAVAGGAAPRPPPKAQAGDLPKFGKIDKSAPRTFGPSSVFQKGDKSKSRESIVRQGSTNMFSMLSGNPEMAAEVAGKSSRPPSRKSVPDGVAPQRRKLQLLPRSVPLENKSESTPAASTVGSEDEADEEPSGTLSVSEADAKARIEEDLKEFFSIRDLQEAEVYFTKLPSEHRHLLVDKLVTKAVESKQEDAQLVADLFERVISRNLCSPASFEEGFTPIAEIIDDIAIDAPKAMDLFVIMIKGSHLHLDEARRTRLASKSMENDKLIQALVADLSRAVKPERASITSASSSLPASQKGGNKLAFRPGSLDMFSMPSAGLDITVKGRSGNPNHPPSRTAPAPHLARSRTPAQFSTRDLQQAQAGVADVVSQHTARPIPTPVDSPQSAPRRRISWEAASECIERSASLFSGLHDVTTALAVFRDLPPSYHGRLVDRLVSAAMGSDTDLMGAQVLAYFFHCAAGRQLCSATAFKEGISMATSALEDIAADVPDALERYAVLVKAMGLHEDLGWRTCMLEKAGSHGAELAAWFSPV